MGRVALLCHLMPGGRQVRESEEMDGSIRVADAGVAAGQIIAVQ